MTSWPKALLASAIALPVILPGASFIQFAAGEDCPGLTDEALTDCSQDHATGFLVPLVVGLGGLAWGLRRIFAGNR